jgi:hypothetical protein
MTARRIFPFEHRPNRKTEVIITDDEVIIIKDEALPYVVEMMRDVGMDLIIELYSRHSIHPTFSVSKPNLPTFAAGT